MPLLMVGCCASSVDLTGTPPGTDSNAMAEGISGPVWKLGTLVLWPFERGNEDNPKGFWGKPCRDKENCLDQCIHGVNGSFHHAMDYSLNIGLHPTLKGHNEPKNLEVLLFESPPSGAGHTSRGTPTRSPQGSPRAVSADQRPWRMPHRQGGCLTFGFDMVVCLLCLLWRSVYWVYWVCGENGKASWSFRYTLPKDSQSIWTNIKFRKGKLLWAVHRFPVFTKASDGFQSMNLQQLAYGWWCSFNDLYGIEARFCDLQAKQIRPEHQLKRVAICSLPCRLGASRDVSWLVGGLNPSEKY